MGATFIRITGILIMTAACVVSVVVLDRNVRLEKPRRAVQLKLVAVQTI